ncbi:cytochrome P450 [Lophiotrema nucula]|uniref:Cytochrome P450 n=1 Tax=Lophiotrema nucula TaxID=690887 RepID=A0A6A5Z8C9_9PLEO|nr:cytochrome P450 [Lophiotrema nucula]
MALSIPVLGCVAALLLAIYKFIIYPAVLSPLAKIPTANLSSRISPLWINYVRWANLENNTLYGLHKRFGPIVQLGPNELSVNTYEGGLKTIYTGNFHKTEFYKNRFTNYGTENSFTMIDKTAHSTRKRMLSNIYSKSVVLASPTIKETTKSVLYERLLPIFAKAADNNDAIDVHRLDYAYAMDSFMAYQFGLSHGSDFIRDVEKRNWYLDNFFGRRPWIYWITEHPRLVEIASQIGLNIVPRWVDQSTDDLESWQIGICDKAEELLTTNPSIASADPGNFPAIFATERAQFQKADGANSKMIASDMYDHNAAAHETSGDTLTYVYYELSRRPELQDALRVELQTLSPQFPPPGTPVTDITLPDPKSVDQLPLLDSVLQETLRRWVAVPGPQFRRTPAQGCSLAGYDNIPGGVRVSCLAYSLHRNPDAFPEPEEWKPERWLHATEESLKEMRRWFWAWGSGGNMCIGSNFATHSMKHAIAAIYSNFTTEVVDAEGIEQAEGFTAGPVGDKLVLRFRRV